MTPTIFISLGNLWSTARSCNAASHEDTSTARLCIRSDRFPARLSSGRNSTTNLKWRHYANPSVMTGCRAPTA